MQERTFTGSAGVSPPWVCKPRFQRHCGKFRRPELACGMRFTGGLTPPALVPTTTTVCRNNDDFCDARTHMHKRGGRQPAVGVHSVERSAWCAPNHLQARFSNHGGLTPPALGSRCTVGEQMAIFATHERRFTRAAGVIPPWFGKGPRLQCTLTDAWRRTTAESRAPGVSPPWVSGKRTCRNASAKSPGTAGGVLTNAGGVAVANHGGLAPPALVATTRTVCLKNDDFCDSPTHIHKSGGRQPAVVR
jgi:hypothetical protein